MRLHLVSHSRKNLCGKTVLDVPASGWRQFEFALTIFNLPFLRMNFPFFSLFVGLPVERTVRPVKSGFFSLPLCYPHCFLFQSSPSCCLFLTLSVCVDPPSVITEQFAYARKASSETALSNRAAISAFFVCTGRFLG